jgi:hypothetical protein
MENELKELILVDLTVMHSDEAPKSKLFYEPVKPKPAIAAEKRCLYMANYEKYSLDGYSEHQRENWVKSKIVVYESDIQVRNFIKQAKDGKIIDEKMYFGKIPSALAEKIKNETEVNVEGYNLAVSAYEIRKIFSSHGNISTEAPRGQRAIIEDDIVNIPLVVCTSDKIELSNTLYEGRPVIVFIKTINGRTTVVSYVSKKSKDLRVQTMYSGKRSGTLATPIDA